jgi:hypothetical protein
MTMSLVTSPPLELMVRALPIFNFFIVDKERGRNTSVSNHSFIRLPHPWLIFLGLSIASDSPRKLSTSIPTPTPSLCGTPKVNGTSYFSPLMVPSLNTSDVVQRATLDEILTIEKTNDIVSCINLNNRTASDSVKNSGFDHNSLSRISNLVLPDHDEIKNFKSNSDSLSHLNDGFYVKSTVNNDVVSSNNSSLDDSGKTGSELEDSLCNIEGNDDPEPLSLILDDPNSISDTQPNLEDDFYDYEHFKDPLEHDSPLGEKPIIGLTLDLQEHFQEPRVQNEKFTKNNLAFEDKCNDSDELASSDKDSLQARLTANPDFINHISFNDDKALELSAFSSQEQTRDDKYGIFTNYQFDSSLRESAINEINFDDMNSECKSVASSEIFNLNSAGFSDEKLNVNCKFINDLDFHIDNNCFEDSKNDYILNSNADNFQQSKDNFPDIKTADIIEDFPISTNNMNIDCASNYEVSHPEGNVNGSFSLSKEINCDFSEFEKQQTFYEEPIFQNDFNDNDDSRSKSNETSDKSSYSINNYVANYQSSLPSLENISLNDEFHDVNKYTSDVSATLEIPISDVIENNFANFETKNLNEGQIKTFESVSDDDDFGDFADFSSAPIKDHTNINLNENIEKSEAHALDDNSIDDFDDFHDFADFESSAPVVERPINLKESMCRIENKNVSVVLFIFFSRIFRILILQFIRNSL